MERKFNFYDVTYEYLKDDYPALHHSLDELTGKCPLINSPQDDTDPIGTFNNYRTDLSQDFSNLLKIFGIEKFRENFKMNGRYQFSRDDVIFLAELLHRYRQKYVWKKEIKRIISQLCEKRGFAQLYQVSKDPEAFADEVAFSVSGFLIMYRSLDGISDESKTEFQKTLLTSTQYQAIDLMRQCKQIEQGICSLCQAM